MVRIKGQAPLAATVYELEKLRCNLCGNVYTAATQPEAGEKKYDESATSMIVLLRYGSGILHLVLLGTSLALVTQGWIYDVVLGVQLGLLAAALAGVEIARYYVLVTWATVQALWNYLRRGVTATWGAAEGTR